MSKAVEVKPLGWSDIERGLPKGWRELARERKLIRALPPHIGAKVTDIGDVLRLVFYLVATSGALLGATAAFSSAGLLSISAVALHKWMKKLGPYLAELLARMVSDTHRCWAPERWAGYEIVLTDATTVERPGAKGTTARVHKALRLSDLRVVAVEVTDEKGGETLRRFLPSAGQLWLGDRAYANPPGIAWAVGHDADVLVRYNRGSLPLYNAEGRSLDVWGKLATLTKVGRPRDWRAFVYTEDGKRIAGRLCAVRLPTDKAAQARVRLRREQGADLTEASLAMADFVVVFTTVPRTRLPCDAVLQLYRLRWQVELEFKRDKSITGLDRLPNFRPDTIESWLYAKLLLHQVLRGVADTDGGVSPGAIAQSFVDSPTQAA